MVFLFSHPSNGYDGLSMKSSNGGTSKQMVSKFQKPLKKSSENYWVVAPHVGTPNKKQKCRYPYSIFILDIM